MSRTTQLATRAPSAWVRRFADMVPAGGRVLDVACGNARHTVLFRDRGHPVWAVDRDTSGLGGLADDPQVTVVTADLETGEPPPFAGERFAGVIVTNYLHRPLLPALVAAVAPGGVLIHETFAQGNERFGKPSNPAFLLAPGELLDAARPTLRVVAYEDVILDTPRPAAVQRVCAVREASMTANPDDITPNSDEPDADAPLSDDDFARGRSAVLVRAARTASGLSQPAFAARYRIPVATLRDWEQGRRVPEAASLAYLQAIERDPATVAGLLGDHG